MVLALALQDLALTYNNSHMTSEYRSCDYCASASPRVPALSLQRSVCMSYVSDALTDQWDEARVVRMSAINTHEGTVKQSRYSKQESTWCIKTCMVGDPGDTMHSVRLVSGWSSLIGNNCVCCSFCMCLLSASLRC